MRRISTNMPNDNMQYYLRRRQFELNRIQSQMGSQTRIQNLRDAPLSAAHSTRYQSHITRLDRYRNNVELTQSRHQVTEGYVREAVDILQRVRELGIQGANGTYSKDDSVAMANEVNELLNELVQIANSENGEGSKIFAGERTRTTPFRVFYGNVADAGGEVITSVDYVGDIGEQRAEIAEGAFISTNFPGNRVFWAEHQQVYSSVDATTYQVAEESTFFIDEVPIELSPGDNAYSIIAKINDSAAAVRARLDPVQNSLVIESTTPHQLWLQDGEGSTVLQDLGILADSSAPPPRNIAPSANVYGGSLFDMVMTLRDQLYEGDTIDVGGSALQGIDTGMRNLLGHLGKLGAESTRLDFAFRRIEHERPEMIDRNSKEVDLDVTQAATDLRILEHTHRAALSTAGRILQPTLLDFLR